MPTPPPTQRAHDGDDDDAVVDARAEVDVDVDVDVPAMTRTVGASVDAPLDVDANDIEAPPQVPPATSELLRGHEFYLARSLSVPRRAELRQLITAHGGDVVERMTGDAVEIVERSHLRPGHHWVGADFVEDTVRHGALRNVIEYMAPVEAPAKATRVRYTVQDDAKMLRFLKDLYPGYLKRSSVPLRIWEDAELMRLTGHSSQSMHERYRKRLVQLTEQERENVLANADAENSGERRRSPPLRTSADQPTPPLKSTRHSSVQLSPRPPVVVRSRRDRSNASSDDEIQGRTRQRIKKARVVASPSPLRSPAARRTSTDTLRLSAKKERESRTPARTPDRRTSPYLRTRATPSSARRPVSAASFSVTRDEGTVQPQDDGTPAGRSGEVFRGYWERFSNDPKERVHLGRFFAPPPPAPAEPPSRTPVRAPRVISQTPSRRTSTSQTPSRRTSSAGGSPAPLSFSTPARASLRPEHDDALAMVEELVGQRMTPPRRKSLDRLAAIQQQLLPQSVATEAEADKEICRLQFRTAQGLNAVCSALYWSSGDVGVASEFLLGRRPRGVWSPLDDQLLVDFKRHDVTESEIAGARRRGAFQRMQVERSAAEILRRILFLL